MNLMKSRKSILFSSQISSLPSLNQQRKNQINLIQNTQNSYIQDDPMNLNSEQLWTEIIPRVFPKESVPFKVQISRKVKQFQSIDLNLQVKNIDFGQLGWGNGQFQLINFQDQKDYIYEYAINKRNAKRKFLKGRAYNRKTLKYQNFQIIDYKVERNLYYFIGSFVQQQPSHISSQRTINNNNKNFQSCKSISYKNSPLKSNTQRPIKKITQQDIIQLKLQSKIQFRQRQKIARIYICFSFQNPWQYLIRLKNAINLRKDIFNRIKFQFYLDNFQKDYDLKIPNSMLKQIQKYVSGQYTSFGISYQDLNLLNNSYHQVMSKIQLTNFLKIQQEQVQAELQNSSNPYKRIVIPKQFKNKQNNHKKQQKFIKVKQGDKVFKLTQKTFKSKLQEFKGKFMYVQDYLTTLMIEVKKIVFSIKSIKIYDHLQNINTVKKNSQQIISTIEKFISDQIYQFQSANTYIHECVIDPIIFLIRQSLKKVNDGWFKLYYPSLAAYSQSRLKRMFLMIQQIIMNECKSLIQNQMQKLNTFLQQYTKFNKDSQKNEQQQLQLKQIQSFMHLKDQQNQNMLGNEEGLNTQSLQDSLLLLDKTPIKQRPVISVLVHMNKNHFKLQPSKEKFLKQMKNMLNVTLKKMQSVNSPQHVIMQHLYGKVFDSKVKLDFPAAQNLEQFSGINWKWIWILKPMKQYLKMIQIQSNYLSEMQTYLQKLQRKINIQLILQEHIITEELQLHQIQNNFRIYENLLKKINFYIPTQNQKICYGMFQIDLQDVRTSLIDKVNSTIFSLKNKLVKDTIHVMKKKEYQLQQAQKQMFKITNNVDELIQRLDYLDNIPQMLREMKISMMTKYFNSCQKYQCYLTHEDMNRYWNNISYTTKIQDQRILRIKHCHQKKKNAIIQLQKEVQDLLQRLGMFDNTQFLIQNQIKKNYAKNSISSVYQRIYQMCSNLSNQYQIIQQKSKKIVFKQKKLCLAQSNVFFVQRIKKQQQILFDMWSAIKLWEDNKNIWMYSSLGSFQMHTRPEELLDKIVNCLKKTQYIVKASNYQQNLFQKDKSSINQNNGENMVLSDSKTLEQPLVQTNQFILKIVVNYQKEVAQFREDPLKLLKILKKKGFSKTHLQKIGIKIQGNLQQFTLQNALKQNFIEHIHQIQAVSNDAWNQFHLEQTMTRVLSSLLKLKFNIFYMHGKNGNGTPLISNYTQMQESIDEIIVNLESIQHNPMKMKYQSRINTFYQSSLYICKSLQICQQFQQKFIDIYPIFDSTDIVKQLPAQNKKFLKIYRLWIQLLTYMKKIQSAYDVCNSQNIFQKVKGMTTKIQQIKISLNQYLRQKRKGFSRFYLLSDSQLFELFSSTNDIQLVCLRISKVFQNIINLKIQDDYVTQVEWNQNVMMLHRPVCYKLMNLQDWLSQLQKTLKQTVFSHVQHLFSLQKRQYNKLVSQKCSQALLLAFQADATFSLDQIKTEKQMEQTLQKHRFLLTNLIHLNKKQKLSEHERINLTSLLVLILHQIQAFEKFIKLKIVQDKQNFQFKKRTKVYTNKQEGKLIGVNVESIQTSFKYGFQFLGSVERLVITNLTERMHIIYMTAFHYCLGGAAMGPAGTGKSQTTKDLANICGKNCLIYNCSQQMNYDSLIRIFKGMIVTGIWMCFDEFNRLKYELFGSISQTLNIIFKYRNFGTEININFHQQTLLLKPSLNFCVTYNPDYEGRSILPTGLIKMFRRVAMVNIDFVAICKLKLFSYGFLDGEQLATQIINLFEMGKIQLDGWNYDFGLRTIKSVIDLAGKKLKDTTNPIAKALQILILPRMVSSHLRLFKSWIKKYFMKEQQKPETIISHSALSMTHTKILPKSQNSNIKLQFLNKSIEVRTGVIVYGKHLSGKHTLLNQFCKNKNQHYASQTIFINALKLQQLYGLIDTSTKAWVNGILPKAIRRILNKFKDQPQKYKNGVIICNGSIYPEWVQSLNSVLDNSKLLSLSSGQSISIPQNLKFIFSCLALGRATPAIISRVGIIYLQQKSQKQLAKSQNYKKIFKQSNNNIDELLQHFFYLLNRVKQFREVNISNLYIWFWVIDYHRLNSLILTVDSFVNIFSIIIEGQLSSQGRKVFALQILLRFPKINIKNVFYSIYQSKPEQQVDGWKQFKIQFQDFSSVKLHQANFIQRKYQSSKFDSRAIFVQTVTFHRVNSFMKGFFNFNGQAQMQNEQQNKLILVAGQAYSGKSCIIQEITSRLSNTTINKNKIYLTKSSNAHKLYETIKSCMHKKNSKKLGAVPGKHIIFQIQNLQLPRSNSLSVNQSSQLIRMILSTNGWYNYENLQFQHFQDTIFVGDFRPQKNKSFKLDQRLYRHIFPMFIKGLQSLDFRYIFKTKVTKWTQFYLNTHSKSNLGFKTDENGKDINEESYEQFVFSLGDQILAQVQNLSNFFKKVIKFTDNRPQLSHLKNKLIYHYSVWDFQKIIQSFLKWNLSLFFFQITKIESVFVFQIQRVMESRLPFKSSVNAFNQILYKQFATNTLTSTQTSISSSTIDSNFNIFHSFNLQSNVPHRYYQQKCEEVTDIDKFVRQIQCVCEQYNSERDQKSQVQITVFPQFCLQLCRITRALSIPNSHLILIGLPKSGKKVLLQLVAFFVRGKLFASQDKYQRKNWYQMLRNSTKQCFLQKMPTICLIQDNYFNTQQLKEDVNIFLNTFYVKDAYTQADFQELIYVMQSQFLKNNIVVNRQNTKKTLIDYLRQNFHMVLSLNPNLGRFKKNMMDYPALMRHCTLSWLNQWPQQALILVSKHQITDQRYQKQNVIAQVHKICKQITSKTRFKYTWQGQYFDFVLSLKQQLKVSNQQLYKIKANYVKGLELINSTETKLQQTKNKIKQLQPGIIHLERQAERTIKHLGMKRSNAMTANQMMKQKNVESQQIIKEAQNLRKYFEQKNLIVNENLQKAWSNVSLVKSHHISEIKALNNPSEFIKIVLTAITIILHDGPIIKQKSEDGLKLQQNYFQTAKRYILNKDAKTIANMLTQYKKQLVTKEIVWKIQQKCRKHQKWSQKQAKSANKAIFYFFIWVQAIVGYFKLFEETQPLRNQLEKVTKIQLQKKQQIKVIKQQLQQYEEQVKRLTEEYESKRQKLLFYGSQITEYSKMLHRGQQIFLQISQQKQKWKNYIKDIEEDINKLFGDCILRCIFISYGSMHNFQKRNLIFEKVRKLLKKNLISVNELFWKYSIEQNQIFKLLEISSNQFVKNNLKTINNSKKLVLLIDPEEEGVRFLTDKNKLELKLLINKVQERSPKLIKMIEDTLVGGRILFIQLTSDSLSNELKTLSKLKLELTLKSMTTSEANANKKLTYNGKSLFINKLAKIYLYTTNTQLNAIDIISNCQTVNFSMTPLLLQKRILRIITMIQFPEIQEQIQDNQKQNIKNLNQLKEIQNKVLNIFTTKTAELLLSTDETLHVLSSSNRLFQQITHKLEEAAKNNQILLEQQKKYESQANNLSNLYFQINKLKDLNPVYQYSFKWFVHILSSNFKNFAQNLYKEISFGLPQKSKILVALLIAEVYYPKIRWDLLFFSNQNKSQQNNKLQVNDIIGTSFLVTSLAANLQISIQYARKIINHAKSYAQKLPGLIDLLNNKSDIFKSLLNCKSQEVLANIPDFFSQTQFFSKILLINCFRAECTLSLVQDWLKINMGQNFMKNAPILKYFQKIPKKMPIILISSQNESQYRKKLYQIFKQMNKYENNVPSILMSTNNIEKLKQGMLGAFQNDQWFLIEGIGGGSLSEELFSQIIQFSQSLDQSKFKFFKIFLLVDDVQTKKLPPHFIKYCHKMTFANELSVIQKISESFFKTVNEIAKLQIRQKSQIKYFMSQLCIFHYFLYEKQKKSKQFSFVFDIFDTDLSILKGFTIYLSKNMDSLKGVIPDIVKQIIYGSTMVNELDINTIKMNISDIMSLSQIQRQLFWQTLWADQKFPKHQDEYSQYLKQLISSKQNPSFSFQNYNQMFGLTQYIQNTQKQLKLSNISQFYKKNIYSLKMSRASSQQQNMKKSMVTVISTSHSKVNLDESNYFVIVKNKIQTFLKLMESIQDQLFETICKLFKNKNASSNSNAYLNTSFFFTKKNKHELTQSQEVDQMQFFLQNEIQSYQKDYMSIKTSLQYHLSMQQPQKDSQIKFYQEVFNNSIPKQWNIYNHVQLNIFIKSFVSRPVQLFNLYKQVKIILKTNFKKVICESINFNLQVIKNVRSFLNQVRRIFSDQMNKNLKTQDLSLRLSSNSNNFISLSSFVDLKALKNMDLVILHEDLLSKSEYKSIRISNLYLFNGSYSKKTNLIEPIKNNKKELSIYRYQNLANMRIFSISKESNNQNFKQAIQQQLFSTLVKNGIKISTCKYKFQLIPLMKYPHEYKMSQEGHDYDYVYMLTLKQRDNQWILRNRVHLATSI